MSRYQYKPWEAKPPAEGEGHDSYGGTYPVDPDRTVAIQTSRAKFFSEMEPWIRSQKLALISYSITGAPWLSVTDLLIRPIYVTFRTKEHAALFKLFWFE